MSVVLQVLVLILSTASFLHSSQAFAPKHVGRMAPSLYVGSNFESSEPVVLTNVASEDSSNALMAADPHSQFAVMEQRLSSFNMEQVLGVTTASAIIGYLTLVLLDNGPSVPLMMSTLEHMVQAWGTQVWGSYEACLASNPVATKAATSATVYTIGDVIAQKSEGLTELDFPRVARSGIAGGIGHGPLSHVWYNLSESFFTHLHITAWWSFFPKIVVDQTVWGPIWNGSYILLLGLMNRENVDEMVGNVKTSTVPLFLDGLKLWPLAHCVTYGLVPVENRLLWVDLVEILWVTILATKAASLASEKDHRKTTMG
eukprot:scaffold867_cov112-Cylindrotheca_fusiformis.AAC.7